MLDHCVSHTRLINFFFIWLLVLKQQTRYHFSKVQFLLQQVAQYFITNRQNMFIKHTKALYSNYLDIGNVYTDESSVLYDLSTD